MTIEQDQVVERLTMCLKEIGITNEQLRFLLIKTALNGGGEIEQRDRQILELVAEVKRLKKALTQIAGYREMAREMVIAGFASTLAVDLCWIARKVLDTED
jgi:hypothetical protein